MFKSVFQRMMWTSCAIILVVIMLITGAMSLLLNNYVKGSKYDAAINASQTIEGLTVTLALENYDTRSLYFYNNSLVTISHVLDSDITVISNTGEVFASTNQTKRVSSKYISAVLSGKIVSESGRFGGVFSERVYIIGVPMEYNDKIVGGVFFSTELPKMKDNVYSLLMMVLIACIIALAIACVLIFIHAKRTATPLRELNKAVLEIASGNFSKRLPPGKDEIGQLSSSFNYMASSLEKLENSRSEFISDVSHELRTPMTSISGFVGGILDGTIPPEKEKEYLRIVYDESRRLAKMTNDMLEMSKMNSSEYKLDVSKFDLSELIRLCIIQLEQKISEKKLELNVTLPEDKLIVIADKAAIQRVIINLLDNAVKFSFERTTVTVSAVRKAKKAYISIGNLGIGIEEKELSNIFDRFYKTDKSRTRDKSGAGLGLSMVKNIINLHKQEVFAESINTGQGSKFTKFTFTLELS